MNFNLVDDIIEIFRPTIDLFAWRNFLNTSIFTKECRTKILTILNHKVELDNQKITLNHAIEKMLDEIIKFFKSGTLTNLITLTPELYDI